MPFVKRSGVSSELDQKLKKKRRKIIEEERIRILRESLMLFYDRLMEKYELIHYRDEGSEMLEKNTDKNEEKDVNPVTREEVESFAREYADTKPLGF